ncbi:hypothetical protein RF11_03270 [Thelohanellus kitauei]|uniref:Uncharacterized protein n=1 Tax=Thelohanellus kitauei TaxID=669202 RepID=A0A0C2JH60_THEKT|nr:hypothetical protein RF11_03270 [Thelohanellus kitauei]
MYFLIISMVNDLIIVDHDNIGSLREGILGFAYNIQTMKILGPRSSIGSILTITLLGVFFNLSSSFFWRKKKKKDKDGGGGGGGSGRGGKDRCPMEKNIVSMKKYLPILFDIFFISNFYLCYVDTTVSIKFSLF